MQPLRQSGRRTASILLALALAFASGMPTLVASAPVQERALPFYPSFPTACAMVLAHPLAQHTWSVLAQVRDLGDVAGVDWEHDEQDNPNATIVRTVFKEQEERYVDLGRSLVQHLREQWLAQGHSAQAVQDHAQGLESLLVECLRLRVHRLRERLDGP